MPLPILYLGSQSKKRQYLLEVAKIPYQVLAHQSDECGIDITHSFHDYVLAIAHHKMQHLIIPLPNQLTPSAETIFVVTADTLVRTKESKTILGKPKDRDDAKRMLRLLCKEVGELATGCSLEKKQYVEKAWQTVIAKKWVTTATLEFCVEESWADRYLDAMPHALHACSAGVVEDFGFNFLKRINGSFTAVLGLPLFELRQALKEMNFF